MNPPSEETQSRPELDMIHQHVAMLQYFELQYGANRYLSLSSAKVHIHVIPCIQCYNYQYVPISQYIVLQYDSIQYPHFKSVMYCVYSNTNGTW